EREGAPPPVELPSELDLGGSHAVALKAHGRDASQENEGPQEKRRAAGRPPVVCPPAERHGVPQRIPSNQHLLEALEIDARAERLPGSEEGTLSVQPARRRED